MIGTIISHYKILEKLGEGGMGVVYKAEDLKLKRVVALKFLPPSLTADTEAKQRFIQEAQAASSLEHPNICNIHEINETDEGRLYIVMACYEGRTLKEILTRGALSVKNAIDITEQIAKGLSKAHAKGIVHRDIKPANILITEDGIVKILDFGLAKLAGQSLHTKTGSTLGTVAYISPEQARGEAIDARTDIWSLGVVLYEMLTGQRPFRGEYDTAMMYSILNESPRSIMEIRPDLPKGMENIDKKCLIKNRLERYHDCGEILKDLHLLQRQILPKIEPTQRTSHGLLKERMKKIFFIFIATAFILIGVGVYLWYTQMNELCKMQKAKQLPRIAILYLTNLGNNADDYYANGITEDIITDVSNVSGLLILAKDEVMAWKGKAIDRNLIHKQLGIDYIMEGAIQRCENQLRVTVQLINAKDGNHVWAQRFDGEAKDVFKFQSEIATSIAASLKIKLSPDENSFLKLRESANIQAYDYYLKGRDNYNNRTKENNVFAEKMYLKCLELDPNYTLAFCGLADVYLQRIDWGLDPNPKWFVEAKRNIDNALRINVNQPEGYFSLNTYYRIQGKHDSSEIAAKKAVLLCPNYYRSHYHLAVALFFKSDWKEAETEFFRTLDLSPTFAEPHRFLMQMSWNEGEPEKALYHAKEAVRLSPSGWHIMRTSAHIMFFLGRFQEAESLLVDLIKSHKSFPFGECFYLLGCIKISQRETNKAIELLTTASSDSNFTPWAYEYIAWAYKLSGKRLEAERMFTKALSSFEKLLSRDQNNGMIAYKVLKLKVQLGKIEDPSQKIIHLDVQSSLQIHPGDREYNIAQIYEAAENPDSALVHLKNAVRTKRFGIRFIEGDPNFDRLRSDSRFIALLK